MSADHPIHGASRGGDFCDHGDAPIRGNGWRRNGFERQCQKAVACKYGGGFPKFFVRGGLAAPQIVIIQSRQIIVDQRIGMDEFDRAAGIKRVRKIGFKNARRFQA